jgi:uncharacterized protein
MENTKERRFFSSTVHFETREGGQDENVIEGYAAVFNKDSEDFGGWFERIAPGAFDEVLNDDAVALFNHDPNQVLGRNGKNVTITQDATGLKYRIKLPDTTLSRDLRQLIKDEIVSQSSFAFTVRTQEWEHNKDKPSIRTIRKVQRLYDVSPVTYPAYPDTSVGARSLEQIKKDLPVIDRSLYIKIQESILNSQKK